MQYTWNKAMYIYDCWHLGQISIGLFKKIAYNRKNYVWCLLHVVCLPFFVNIGLVLISKVTWAITSCTYKFTACARVSILGHLQAVSHSSAVLPATCTICGTMGCPFCPCMLLINQYAWLIIGHSYCKDGHTPFLFCYSICRAEALFRRTSSKVHNHHSVLYTCPICPI